MKKKSPSTHVNRLKPKDIERMVTLGVVTSSRVEGITVREMDGKLVFHKGTPPGRPTL